jgi:hypothetical protein
MAYYRDKRKLSVSLCVFVTPLHQQQVEDGKMIKFIFAAENRINNLPWMSAETSECSREITQISN